MTFADLVAGDSVFVDANTFIYYFGPDPVFGAVCRQLIQSIDSQQLHGFTSTHVLAEVAHQLMIIEASTLPGWTLGKVRQRLQQQPSAKKKGVGSLFTPLAILKDSRPLILPCLILPGSNVLDPGANGK